MQSYRFMLTAGFAMFSMFFGSGNLVFPLLVGYQSLNQYPYAIIGLIITAVCIPFLGLLGIIQCHGDHRAYFSNLGKPLAFILTFLMLSLIGPFGVIPRCITVAYGGIVQMIPTLSFALFSFLFCLITGALVWKRNKIVDIIGLVLTPFKLGSIVLLIRVGLWFGGEVVVSSKSSTEAFNLGIIQGYQTMDLIAAFFFACTIYDYLKSGLLKSNNNQQEKFLFKMGIYSSLVGGLLLSIVYVGFTMLGAKYAFILEDTAPECMLAQIAQFTLGQYAMPIIVLTLAFSYLATAIVLTTVFVDFLQDDISKGKLTRPQSICITLSIAFGLSLLGFKTICLCLGNFLEWVYPLLVLYAIFKIFNNLSLFRKVKLEPL